MRLQVTGLEEQIDAKAKQIDLIQGELAGVIDLRDKKLVPVTRVNSLKRDAAGLEGERGQLVAAKVEATGKIAEIELQIIQVDQDARSKAAEELSDVSAKVIGPGETMVLIVPEKRVERSGRRSRPMISTNCFQVRQPCCASHRLISGPRPSSNPHP